ncbi:MAG: carboxypeptidase regulatory-like domain-containing protein [Gemmatimonadetes bacterium]|nr:carboxypeptidase regulatory-like domain-containing protein [Gemmatimonadota bacterium]
MHRTSALPVLLAALALPATAPAASLEAQGPDRGAISGLVLEDGALTPLDGAVVELVGTRVRVATGADGAFALRNLPAGTLTLKVAAPGYVTLTENVEIAPLETVLLQLRLPKVGVALEELLVSVGARRPGSDPASTAAGDRVDSGDSALDLLANQIVGVDVRRGEHGAPAWIVIRGYTTVTGSNAPVVYLDGVRISTLDILQQIPAGSVSSIRVLRGAAASAHFMDAANGVILVETRRAPGEGGAGGG